MRIAVCHHTLAVNIWVTMEMMLAVLCSPSLSFLVLVGRVDPRANVLSLFLIASGPCGICAGLCICC